MSTVTVRVLRCCSILGAMALSVLSCQAITRSFGAGGSGGAATGTTTGSGGATSSSHGSGATGGGGGGVGPGGGDSGAADGPVTCTGTQMACEGHCVDIATASTDCGACGHDCGGGMCQLGQCQPALVYAAALPIGPIAVSTTEVYFSTNDDANEVYKLLACPITGCVLAPRQLTSMEYNINAISWVADPTTPTVVFQSAPPQNTERPAVFPCPETGCPGALTSVVSDGLGSFQGSLPVFGDQVYYDSQDLGLGALTCTAGTCTAGGALSVKDIDVFIAGQNYEYYIDTYNPTAGTHMGYIYRCDISVSPCSPVTILMQNMSAAVGLQVQGGSLYWMIPGQQGTQNGAIQTCSTPACNDVAFLVKGLSGPSDLVVDMAGAYWITSTPSIQRCVGPTCAGGAEDLTTAVTAPHDLRTDASFVYWADGDSIYRIAK